MQKNFDFSAILILPGISVSTKKVYAAYRHDIIRYQQIKTEINDYVQKNRIDLAAKMCANMLETTCFGLYEELAELKVKIESCGIRPISLSGSGSTMFYIHDKSNGGRAREYQRKLDKITGCKSVIVTNNRW